jgi:hypothetical protein
MAGEIHFLFNSIEASHSLVDAGKFRGIAVTGRERSPVLPNVPTLKESGYDGFEDLIICLGMLAPAGTPEPIVKMLKAELMRIARLPDVSKRINTSSSTLVGGTGEDFAAAITRETRSGPQSSKRTTSGSVINRSPGRPWISVGSAPLRGAEIDEINREATAQLARRLMLAHSASFRRAKAFPRRTESSSGRAQ